MMQITVVRYLNIIGISFCLTCSMACSSSKPEPEPEIAEIAAPKNAVRDGSETELVEAGKRLFQSGAYGIAKENFDSLKSSFPDSPYVEYAEIKAADADFELNEFAAAGQRYEEFISNHPGSKTVPYAMVRAGRSYQLSSRGIGRDSEPLKKAVGFFDRLIQEHGASSYARMATTYRLETLKQLGETEQEIMEFYERQGNTAAYEARKKEFDERWAPVLAQALADESVDAPVVQVAYEAPLPSEEPTTTGATTDAKTKITPEQARARAALERGTGPWLEFIECKDVGEKMTQLFFTKPVADTDVSFEAVTVGGETAVKVSIAGVRAREEKKSCFGSGDIEISSDGSLLIKGQGTPEVMTLTNPDRVVLVFG